MNDGSSGMTNLRMLRSSKNRFGSSDEVGVYEMTQGRLLPVSDPSSLFLAHRNDQDDVEGCAIAV
jgi:DNA repair protein RadA/Sms